MNDVAKPQQIVRILHTKLYIPQAHEELVHRPRLMEQLNEVQRRPLMLICAPAGSGKTTLLATWLAQSSLRAGWVSLDKRDNEDTRFWAYFIAALQTIQPTLGQDFLALLQSPQPPPIENILIDLLNDASALSDHFLLVLDDYHAIESESIHQGITFLLENIPPQMHLVIASRSHPKLPLSQLRARRKLVELGPTDLNFSPDEAASFLNQVMKLELTLQEVRTLKEVTEGWAAGLHLAALALQSMQVGQATLDIDAFVRSFSGGHHYLFDYLSQEILEKQSPDLQQFMRHTSILERMNAALCSAVVNSPTQVAQEFLENLLQANLFIIPLDEQRRWFRYHPLFSAFLRKNLAANLEEDKIADLHRRASEWYGNQELFADAVDHAFDASDFPMAARWIDQAAENMFVHSELNTLLKWLDNLPKAVLQQMPRLNTVYAWALLATGRPFEIEPHLEAVENYLGITLAEAARMPNIPELPAETRGALAEIACLRSSLSFNEFKLQNVLMFKDLIQTLLTEDVVGGHFNIRLDLLGVAFFNAAMAYEYSGDTISAVQAFTHTITFSPQNFHLLPLAYSHLAQLHIIQGQLKQAEKAYQEALLTAEQAPVTSPMAGLAHSGLGSLLCERNKLEEAAIHLNKGLELGRIWNQWESLTPAYASLARLLIAQGNELAALAKINEMAEMAVRTKTEWIIPGVEMYQAFFAARTGSLEEATAWAQTQTTDYPDGLIPYLTEPGALIHAKVLLYLDNHEKALSLLHKLLNAAEAGHRWGRVIEILVNLSVAYEATGNRPAAIESLKRALVLAEPQGYVRIFVDEGPAMATLLHKLVAHSISASLSKYCQSLLKAFLVKSQTSMKTQPASPEDQPDSEEFLLLSEREMQVLRLLAEGRTNQEVSEILFISINTVKSHVKKILHTLGVENRTQASARARELGLL